MPDPGDRKPDTPEPANPDAQTAPESLPIAVGTLYKPSHGHGMLRHGNPGNGGGGRPRSVIREALRESFAKRVPVLEQIADGQIAASPKERIAAVEVMGRYGLGQQKEVSSDDVRHKLEQTLDLIRVHCDAETAERLIAAMRPVWTS